MFGASKTASVSGGGTDPQFDYVTLLLNGDGTNGAQNNTFLDSSSNAFSITRNGNTTQGSFSPYGSLWSNYLNTSSKLSFGTGSQFAFGTSDYTIEFWVNVQTAPSVYAGVGAWYYGSPTNVALFVNSGMGITLSYAGGALSTSGITLAIGSWYHVAVSRQSGTSTIYVNGVSYASGSPSYNVTSTRAFTVNGDGGSGDPGSFMNAYFSNVRAVNGTAVYTSNFTPSTTPLTAISGTALLTCQSNRFIDNSSNAVSPTITGTPSVQRFSPFNPTTAYTTATIGGSGYFDGSGDYLNTPSSTASAVDFAGAYTLEGWFYLTATPGSGYYGDPIISTSSGSGNNWKFWGFSSTNKFTFATRDASTFNQITFSQNTPLNQWFHFAFVMNSTTTGTAYINGVSVGTSTDSTSFSTQSSYNVVIGDVSLGGTSYFNGYMSNLRFSNIARYTTTFTPSTTPLSSDANTTLLLSYANAGIPDYAMMNDLETVGNAQVSTSVKKFGTGSLYFDGAGDSIDGTSINYSMGTGNYTMEGWAYWLGTGNNIGLMSTFGALDGTSITLYNGNIYASEGHTGIGGNETYETAPSANTWFHFAVVRNNSTLRLYINGVNTRSVSSSTNLNATLLRLGVKLTDYNDQYWYGYLDDVRITKGYARYTSNFTPPIAALPTY